jgi:hypothetical protein
MPTRKKNPGKVLVFNNDIRVRFVIFKIDIKSWLKVFDQRILKKEGILFRIYNGELNMMYPAYKFMRFITAKIFEKIRAYPFSQIFSFTYIK